VKTDRPPKTKIQNDFLGPFIECNGAINRPTANSSLLESKLIRISRIPRSSKVKIKDENGCEEYWHQCGSSVAYKESRDTMSKVEFERFAANGCAELLVLLPKAPRALIKNLHPKGHFDHGSKEFRDHLNLTRSLCDAAIKRRRTLATINSAVR